MDSLQCHVRDAMPIQGEWVRNSRNYDRAMCEHLAFLQYSTSRYHDCMFMDIPVELKKGKTGSMFFNLLTYADMRLNPRTESITMYSKYNDDIINEVLLIKTSKLVKHIIKNDTIARVLLFAASLLPVEYRPMFQCTISYSALRDISEYVIKG